MTRNERREDSWVPDKVLHDFVNELVETKSKLKWNQEISITVPSDLNEKELESLVIETGYYIKSKTGTEMTVVNNKPIDSLRLVAQGYLINR